MGSPGRLAGGIDGIGLRQDLVRLPGGEQPAAELEPRRAVAVGDEAVAADATPA